MRKSMLVVALALCMSMTAFAQHTPVPDAASCPATQDEFGNPVNWTFVPLPQFSIFVLGGPVNFAATAGQVDFCAYADIIFCSLGPVAAVVPEVADFAYLVQCSNMDINGPLDMEAEIPVTGNGMPDGQYELGVLAAILNDTSHPLNAQATAAYEGYYVGIKNLVVDALAIAELKNEKDVRGIVQAAAPYLVASLTALLAGMATMGDPTTNAALDELLGLLSDIGLTPPEGGIGSLGTPVPAVGPEGDVDADGYTNRQEYNCCVKLGACPASEYVAKALDVEEIPECPTPIVTIQNLKNRYNFGDTVEVTAVLNIGTPISYVWKKEDVVLADETGATLLISNAQAADGGNYSVTVTFDDGEKAIVDLTKAFFLDVGDYPVPVAGMLGLSLLAGACAVAGVAGIRRRK